MTKLQTPSIALARKALFALAVGLLAAGSAQAGPLGVDGTIGAEWAGANTVSVLYNPAAPTGNFGAPTNQNSEVGYTIYTRSDSLYVYVGLQTSTNYAGGLNFANLYFDTNPGSGSDVGFEVSNQQAFIPGSPGYFPYTVALNDIHYALTAGSASTPSVIEFAVPVAFFTTDPLGMGFPVATTAVQLRLSQSFGYSVAGGSSYGPDRLGTVSLASTAVPEPATVGALVLGLALPLAMRVRRRGH